MDSTNSKLLLKSIDTQALIERAIELAIAEDLGLECKDLTTDAIVAGDVLAFGSIYLKEPGVVVGLNVMERVFRRFDERIKLNALTVAVQIIDETPCKIAEFQGPAAAILKGERLALNLLQRMSGIATITHQFVQKSRNLAIEILDTRKTTPCLRAFERLAVVAAGGTNHRFGLFDAVLIKDNHVRLAGGTTRAIELARQANPGKRIEVETTTLDEVREAVAAGAERIMLDNMSPKTIREAIAIIAGRAYIEVSGGIKLANINDYLINGVNGISIGALTHSAPSLDISLEVERYV